MELTDDDVHPRVRIDHLLTLGIALTSTRDFDAAGQRFAAAATELFARERNSRAKVLQAIFETDEARRDSERFRLMSLYDPLTGLHNRRFVNERLPALLGAAEEPESQSWSRSWTSTTSSRSTTGAATTRVTPSSPSSPGCWPKRPRRAASPHDWGRGVPAGPPRHRCGGCRPALRGGAGEPARPRLAADRR